MTGLPEIQTERATGDTAAGTLTRIWQTILGIDSIDVDQDFFDLGGDSSLAVQMFAEIQKSFGIKLPLVTLYEAPTIAALEHFLTAEAKGGWSPLVAIQPGGSRPAFFCFHGAGGNVLSYRKLSQYLGPDQPFFGLQCHGLDGTSAPLETIEEMAALYVTHIRDVQPHGPYFIGGYCMGGTVAYEAAQQLQAAGEPVALLALFDTMNWHKLPLTRWTKLSHASQRIAFHTTGFLNLDFNDKGKFFRDKVEDLRNRIPVWVGGVKAIFEKRRAVHTESVMLAQLWKTNDHACWTYVPKPYGGLLTDFRPCRQYRVFNSAELKWSGLVREEKVIVLPVYPAGMLVEPFVGHLAAALSTSIDDAIYGLTARPN